MNNGINTTSSEDLKKKRNFAFISYNHKDVKWAKWLRKRLEWYRMPAEIHNEFSDSRYIRPVFRDRDTLTSGVLNDTLRKHLEESKYLVVICSPNSAKSQWVSDEIQTFIDMGRLEYIVPFIVDGVPQDYSKSDISQPLMGECFPLALRKWNTEHPEKNLLGIAVTDDGKTDKERAFIRLVAHMLGLEFDTLWHRHKRFIKKVAYFLSLFAVIALFLTYWFMVPVKASVTILDEKSHLPEMEKGILLVNGGEYSFAKPDTTIELNPLPGYYRLRSLPMSVKTDKYYEEATQDLEVGWGMSRQAYIQMHRDSTFAIYGGHVYDGGYDDPWSHPISGAEVSLSGHVVSTDDNGYFRIALSLSEQAQELPIRIKKAGYKDYYREEEVANDSLSYLLSK